MSIDRVPAFRILPAMNPLKFAAAVSVASCALAASSPPTPSAEVRAAELAFASTMERRDLSAFRDFVSEEAVFFSKDNALRGRAAVVEEWKRFFEGPTAPFSWAPEIIEVLDSGRLALSSGPVYDQAKKVTARFTSIWRLEDDGKWRVIFDKGSPVCP